MSDNLTDPIYTDEAKARAHFEAIRWPNGPVCSHCGTVNEATLVQGKSHRPGMYQCNACRKPFSVTTGTVMESSHIPLNKWALGFYLYASSKKGFSAHQLHRMIGITYKSAWFMAHRIREAMNDTKAPPMGGEGKIVEVDETFQGPAGTYVHPRQGMRKKSGFGDKRIVVSLVERNGRAKSVKIDKLTLDAVKAIVTANVDSASTLMTDEASRYREIGKDFASHDTVNHGAKEYARGIVSTNTVEGFYSIFKRGMTGVYQHCGEQHLQRYMHEFDFRYSNRIALGVDDVMRTARAIRAAEGKRLTYNQSRSAQ